jgi:hypothetical protein
VHYKVLNFHTSGINTKSVKAGEFPVKAEKSGFSNCYGFIKIFTLPIFCNRSFIISRVAFSGKSEVKCQFFQEQFKEQGIRT